MIDRNRFFHLRVSYKNDSNYGFIEPFIIWKGLLSGVLVTDTGKKVWLRLRYAILCRLKILNAKELNDIVNNPNNVYYQ